jgi:hypothetical protein
MKVDLNTERMRGYGDYRIDSYTVNKLFGLDDFCKKYCTKEKHFLNLVVILV